MGIGPLKIGLTGGIGSGKSTVAAMLVPLGAALIDTDAISRALTAAGGAALPALRREFGDAIFNADGSLDRAAMRTRAFADATVRHRLEAVLHPLIGAEAQRQADAANSAALVFVADHRSLAVVGPKSGPQLKSSVDDCSTAARQLRYALATQV